MIINALRKMMKNNRFSAKSGLPHADGILRALNPPIREMKTE